MRYIPNKDAGGDIKEIVGQVQISFNFQTSNFLQSKASYMLDQFIKNGYQIDTGSVTTTWNQCTACSILGVLPIAPPVQQLVVQQPQPVIPVHAQPGRRNFARRSQPFTHPHVQQEKKEEEEKEEEREVLLMMIHRKHWGTKGLLTMKRRM